MTHQISLLYTVHKCITVYDMFLRNIQSGLMSLYCVVLSLPSDLGAAAASGFGTHQIVLLVETVFHQLFACYIVFKCTTGFCPSV